VKTSIQGGCIYYQQSSVAKIPARPKYMLHRGDNHVWNFENVHQHHFCFLYLSKVSFAPGTQTRTHARVALGFPLSQAINHKITLRVQLIFSPLLTVFKAKVIFNLVKNVLQQFGGFFFFLRQSL
jgi:hypothetical protein